MSIYPAVTKSRYRNTLGPNHETPNPGVSVRRNMKCIKVSRVEKV